MSIGSGRMEKGFSLTEVMVSLMIFMVASMGLLPLVHTSLKVNRGLRLQSQARRLAGGTMAELQVIDYARLARITEDPLLAGEIEIRRRIEPNLPLPDQSRITVTASWQLQDQTHSFQLQAVRTMP